MTVYIEAEETDCDHTTLRYAARFPSMRACKKVYKETRDSAEGRVCWSRISKADYIAYKQSEAEHYANYRQY